MSAVKVNDKKKDTPDYAIPRDFTLREHAKSRKAWEIGDVDSITAVVEFRGESGASRAARALGLADASGEATRRFDVRRTDSFARWLLSFAGDAVPIAPPTLVQEYRALLQSTLARYSSVRTLATGTATDG
jgi:proteasome accessory factor B